MEKESVVDLLDLLSNKDLLEQARSDKYSWHGYANLDTEAKFQGRKCEQIALILLIVSRILQMEDQEDDILTGKIDAGINRKEAEEIFYNYLRKLNNQYLGYNATQNIRLDYIPYFFKLITQHFPKK